MLLLRFDDIHIYIYIYLYICLYTYDVYTHKYLDTHQIYYTPQRLELLAGFLQ